MKKIVLVFLLSILLSLSVAPAFAHPGNTNSSGGHYDRSTSEYHYHHGYSAHQHTDLNGDGVPDCPYEFKDKTATVTSKPVHTSTPRKISTPAPTSNPSSMSRAEKEFLKITVGIAAFLILMCSIVKRSKKQKKLRLEEAEQLKEKREEDNRLLYDEYVRQQEAEIQSQNEIEIEQEKFQKDKERYIELYGNVPTAIASGADAFCYIGKDGLPASRVAKHGERWGDWFTLYVTYNGKCYHERTCIHLHRRDVRQINAFNVATSHYYPCSECNPVLPDMRWVNEYKRIESIREKYDIPEP